MGEGERERGRERELQHTSDAYVGSCVTIATQQMYSLPFIGERGRMEGRVDGREGGW
mgnify:CR=1 FL=1